MQNNFTDIVKYNNEATKLSFYKSNEIQNIRDEKGESLINVTFTSQDNKNHLNIVPKSFKIPSSNGGNSFSYNLPFEMGPVCVKYSHMGGRGGVLTSEKNMDFSILPPDTKFDLIFDDKFTNEQQKQILENLSIDCEEHVKNIYECASELIDKVKDALWEGGLKTSATAKKNRSKLISENNSKTQKLSMEEIEEICKSDIKRNSIKSFANPILNKYNIVENTIKVERYCYRLLTKFELTNKLEIWKQQILEAALENDERFKFLFDPINTEESKKKFSPKIYNHYKIFEPITKATIMTHSRYLEKIGKSKSEIENICYELSNAETAKMIQTNSENFLPYTIGPITDLKYVDEKIVKRGDTIIIMGSVNVYTSPNYGIRFFVDSILKLATSANEVKKEQSGNVIINKYCCGVVSDTSNDSKSPLQLTNGELNENNNHTNKRNIQELEGSNLTMDKNYDDDGDNIDNEKEEIVYSSDTNANNLKKKKIQTIQNTQEHQYLIEENL